MRRVFFPGCGFGFWFLLPRLFQVADEDHHICGASAGALMCAIALLDPADHSYAAIRDIALEVLGELTFPPNMYTLNKRFVEKVLSRASREKIGRVSVQLTKVCDDLTLEKVIVHPQTIEELAELILISTYVPFLSRNDSNSLLCEKDGEHFVDGSLYNIVHGDDADAVPDNRYAGIPFIVPTEASCRKMFKEGSICFGT